MNIISEFGSNKLTRSRKARVACFFLRAEDGIRDDLVTGVQTCALPICRWRLPRRASDVSVLQGSRQRPLRRRRLQAAKGRQRPASSAHRDQVRARVTQFLQAVRRALRRLPRKADLPGVRRRRTRASGSAHPRIPHAHRPPGTTAAPDGGRGCPISALIDLHTHTTASDGRCTPAELVARASAAGIRVLSVTDHDTVAGCGAAAAACATSGIDFVAGIEITAVRGDVDVHTLGYFIDVGAPAFAAFLAEQRNRRIERAREMIGRLRVFGIDLDADAILRPALNDPSQAVGRPWIARALVAAGHVANTSEAFDRWLVRGRPAFVPRVAAEPTEVIDRIHEVGGLASVAHPGPLGRDEWLPGFVEAGLDA